MYQKILNFIKYNNAFTLVLMVFFLGFGVTFAASPDARASVYGSEQAVVSVDNSSIISADLDNFNFNLRINAITEDTKNYYAAYSYQTLTIDNSFWQNKTIEKTLTISKEALDGKDLGLYVAKELGENINYELSYLKRVQKLEKEKGESQKVVTTEYSGLIGKLLDPKQEVIEGYNPVIAEVVPEVPTTAESNPAAVIVSTPYYEPSEKTASDSTSSGQATPPPTPEQMVNEKKVQEVVNELQSAASSTPTDLATSTPEIIPEPVPAPSPDQGEGQGGVTPEPAVENPPAPEPTPE